MASRTGEAPWFGYHFGSVEPTPGSVFYVAVDNDDGTKSWYSIWVPPGQDLTKSDSELVFDWLAVSSTDPNYVPEILGDVSLVETVFDGGSGVAITNLLITGALLMVLLGGASLFNEALEENLRGVRLTPTLPGPLAVVNDFGRRVWGAIAAAWAVIVPGDTWVDRAIGPAALLIGTGFIYGFLEPGFGWNQRSMVIFLSLMASQGLIVLFYEGGKAWMLRRRAVHAGMRLFPACVLIALISVGLSRLGGIEPGFVIGFVAAAVVIGAQPTDVAMRGKAYGAVALGLLIVGVVAWLAAIPLHDLYLDHPSFWTALPTSISLLVFIVAIEGLLFSLIPLEFMDGSRIWRWSKLAWLGLFVPAALLFLQILFNDGDAYMDLIGSSRSAIGVLVLLIYMVACFGTWAYFKRRTSQQSTELEPGAAPGQ